MLKLLFPRFLTFYAATIVIQNKSFASENFRQFTNLRNLLDSRIGTSDLCQKLTNRLHNNCTHVHNNNNNKIRPSLGSQTMETRITNFRPGDFIYDKHPEYYLK